MKERAATMYTTKRRMYHKMKNRLIEPETQFEAYLTRDF